jgi:iron complex outermembrane recepter protein
MHSLRLTFAALLFSSAAIPAFAEDARNFKIPAQSLASAITTLSQQSGLHVFYADSALQNKEAPP